ncbi:hypothetical protein EHI8A_001110 [Entamoeba histolytica HM-1:IMSS-B]|uniref:Uncharacterized protein n=6 Tax=Entamoeba histolytica TaxID=5759 RepID=C4M0J7_ENTH1|nr:hypothetical protein EHI_024550 [Entamoeba histolytica HM-1:IMSS]EMD46252.1 Hypothetical protein EHI5A_011200 [Entamoeba histolytica KU27]EMH73963.1 hypothetical protein EHI8A_001110 [Entamoeba histolytica HM-1:IMSS-B]EMS11671.1 hypothetical protein KM1_011450 [Entamoeba histolytica HM-3:IMSS]ENY65374.1 hypothetical protein EHI7A_002560 [Entamoeba histolytica HM-1:IMSS-A]GAT94688.1 hypothetical protein CL6EHI_024550 [Entamoeba histolytica]|eukprot:XP_652284.1 hypothetical protein EHI_024550 [Entamoeba histolytica HM-1:IMSS]
MSKSENFKPFKLNQQQNIKKPLFHSNFTSKLVLGKKPITIKTQNNDLKKPFTIHPRNFTSHKPKEEIHIDSFSIEEVSQHQNEDYDISIESYSQKEEELKKYMKDDDEEITQLLSQSVFKRTPKPSDTSLSYEEKNNLTQPSSDDSWKTVSVQKFTKECPQIYHLENITTSLSLNKQIEDSKLNSKVLLKNSQIPIEQENKQKTYDLSTESCSPKITTESFGSLSLKGIESLFTNKILEPNILNNNTVSLEESQHKEEQNGSMTIEENIKDEHNELELEDVVRQVDKYNEIEQKEIFIDDKQDKWESMEITTYQEQKQDDHSLSSATELSQRCSMEWAKDEYEENKLQETIQSIRDLKSESRIDNLSDTNNIQVTLLNKEDILKQRDGILFYKKFNSIEHSSQVDSDFKFGKPCNKEWKIVTYNKEPFIINKSNYSIYLATCGKLVFFAIKPSSPNKCPLKVEIDDCVFIHNDPPIYFINECNIIDSMSLSSVPLSLKLMYNHHIKEVQVIAEKKIPCLNSIVNIDCEFNETIILNCQIVQQLSFNIPDTLFGEVAAIVKEEGKGYIFIFPKNTWGYVNEYCSTESKRMKGIYIRDLYLNLSTSAVPIYRFQCLI